MKQILGRFLKRLPQKKPREDAPDGHPNASARISVTIGSGLEKTAPFVKTLRRTLAEQRSVFWIFIATVQIWIAALFIFGCVFVLQSRPVQIAESKPTLKEEHKALIEEVGIRRDHFDLFVISTLGILLGVDDSGASYRPLLKGSVDPNILSRFEQETLNNLSNIRKNMMVQNLTVNTIREFTFNSETGVASAYVMGYIATIIQQSERGQRAGTLPFRARVFIRSSPRSNLTPQGFYMVDLEDRIGDDALAWDREVLK